MEPLLRPWFAAVDRLLPTYVPNPLSASERAPGWRIQLIGGDGVGRGREIPVRSQIEIDDGLRPHEQRVLREAFELFSLAIRIDCDAFMVALLPKMPWVRASWTYEPFADDEWLKLQVIADLKASESDFFSAFFAEKTHSNKYNETKSALLHLGGLAELESPLAPELEMLVQLDVVPGAYYTPAKLTEMLRAINREVFAVSKILIVLSTEVEPAEMVELFRVVHSFRDTAEVEIQFDVPSASNDHTKLIRWKWFWDLAARRAYRKQLEGETLKSWTVWATFGDGVLARRDGFSSAATSIACLSALAHAGEYVTNATICMALEEPRYDRHVRIKYLGYLLRAGVETLAVRDRSLTLHEVNLITDVYSKTTMDECLRALHEPSWRGKKTRRLDDKNASKFLAAKNEVLGLMQETTSSDETVDVYLTGYGQCSVNRSLVSELKSQPLPTRRLKSLDLLFLSGAETVPSVVQLVRLVGRELTKLQLEIDTGTYTLPMLRTVLEACPSLNKLIVKPVDIDEDDDETEYPVPAPRQPLQVLHVEIKAAFAESDGLMGLFRLLAQYTVELKEFEMFAEQRVVCRHDVAPAVNRFFLEGMPQLRKLRIIGFNSGYLRWLWRRHTATPSTIQVLLLENVMWDDTDWTAFCQMLGDNTHPLTQSMHTLHLKLTGWVVKVDELHAALESNQFLANVSIDVKQGTGERAGFMQRAQATNGRSVFHVKEKLSARHKAAFLSAMTARNVSMEVDNLTSIFDYATTTMTRYVRLHLVSASPDPAMPFF